MGVNYMKPNYYLIGSQYEYSPNNYEDVFPQMVSKSAVSVGYANYNLSKLFGKPENEIISKIIVYWILFFVDKFLL